MLTVRDIMTLEVQTVTPETTLREVAEALSSAHVSGLPVVSGRRVVGVVTATDVMEFAASAPGTPTLRRTPGAWTELPDVEMEFPDDDEDEAPGAYYTDYWDDVGASLVERFERTDAPEWAVLDEEVASEVMSTGVISVAPDTSIREAARRMLEAGIHRLLVMEDDELLGILTTTDLVEAISQYGIEA